MNLNHLILPLGNTILMLDVFFIKFTLYCIGNYTFMLGDEMEMQPRTTSPKNCYYIHEFKSFNVAVWQVADKLIVYTVIMP